MQSPGFLTFTPSILAFDLDFQFDPIQRVNVEVFQEVIRKSAGQLLESQKLLTLESVLQNNLIVRLAISKSSNYQEGASQQNKYT